MQEVLESYDPFIPSNSRDCEENTIIDMFNKQKQKSSTFIDMTG